MGCGLLLFLGLTLTAIFFLMPSTDPETSPYSRFDQYKHIERSKDCVRTMLKDPDSARFRNIVFISSHSSGKLLPVVFGEVNARNSLGGYVGYRRFVSTGSVGETFFERVEGGEVDNELIDFDAKLEALGLK